MTILAHLETIQWWWYWWRWPFPWKPPRFWPTHNLHHVSHQNLPQGSGPPGDNPLLSPLLAPPPLALTSGCSVRGRPALAVKRALLYWSVFLQIFLAIIFSITLLVSIPANILGHHLWHHSIGRYSCTSTSCPSSLAFLYWSVFLQIFFFFGIILSVSIPAQAHLCHHLDHHLGLYSIILKRSAGILL